MTISTASPVALPVAPIPGLTFRHLRDPEDWAPLAELMNRCHLADGVQEVLTSENLAVEWATGDRLVPTRDIVLAEHDGLLVAFAIAFLMPRDDMHALEALGGVDPVVRRRGVGTALNRWARAHLQALAAADPRPGRREHRGWALEQEAGSVALLEAEGYARIRFGFEMRRPLTGELPVHALPDGLELRAVDPTMHRAIFDADDEAFVDHWGHHPATESDFVRMYSEPDLDTGLWQVAWDGDEVAGLVVVAVYRDENAALGISRGWLERVAVRRPWRGRGLAKALCASAFATLRERGIREAWLGVDGANPTGALALYEGLGFHVARRWFVFGRPLD